MGRDGQDDAASIGVQDFERLGVALEESLVALYTATTALQRDADRAASIHPSALGPLLHVAEQARRRGEQLLAPSAGLLLRTIEAERALPEAIAAQRAALDEADRANRARTIAEQELVRARAELATVPMRLYEAGEQARDEERLNTLDVVQALAEHDGTASQAFRARLADALDERATPVGMPHLTLG